MTLKPRSAFSSWREETPRSSNRPADSLRSRVGRALLSASRNLLCRNVTRPPNGRKPFAGVLDRVGILIERENIGAGAQNCFAVPATAAGRIDDKRAGARRQQLDRFRARAPDDDK